MRSLFIALPLLALAACQPQSPAENSSLPPARPTEAAPPATPDTVAASSEAASNTTEASHVVPGVRMSLLRLGADASAALPALGKPDFGDAAMQKAWATWYGETHPTNELLKGPAGSSSGQLDVYTAPQNNDVNHHTVQIARTTRADWRLPDGLGFGSPLAAIRAAYGQLPLAATYQLKVGTRYLYDDVPRGVAFETDGQAPDSRCRALIVHLPGQALMAAALPMPEYLKQLK